MKKILLLAVASVIAVTACKKSVSGQTGQWTSNLNELAEASGKYPNLKALLDAKATEAKAIFAEAEKISDEEQKAEKIAAAIAKLRENLGVVVEVKYKSQAIDSTIERVTKIKTTKDKVKKAESEIKAIRKEQEAIEQSMKALKPANGEELNMQVRELVGKLISLSGRADGVLKLVKGK